MKVRRVLGTASVALLIVALGAALCGAVTVNGRGHLTGWGNGVLRVEGSGSFYVRGSGTLTIRDLDRDADIEIHGFGYSRTLPSGLRIYQGTGWVRVSAPDAMVKLEGVVDDFSVRGRGTCYLQGTGRYRVRARTRIWRSGGVYVHFNPVP